MIFGWKNIHFAEYISGVITSVSPPLTVKDDVPSAPAICFCRLGEFRGDFRPITGDERESLGDPPGLTDTRLLPMMLGLLPLLLVFVSEHCAMGSGASTAL